MKFIFTHLIMIILTITISSCATSRERKPFMIVGKVEEPTFTGGGISFNYFLASSNMNGNALNTKYKSFTYVGLSSSIGGGIWKGQYGLSLNYGLAYKFYSKDKTDPNNSNKTQTVESFTCQETKPTFIVTRQVYRNKMGTSFFIDLFYSPYLESRFTSVKTRPDNKLYAHGSSYGASLFVATKFLGCDISARQVSYKQDLSEKIIGFGCGFGFTLF